jgi:hypothetical protein
MLGIDDPFIDCARVLRTLIVNILRFFGITGPTFLFTAEGHAPAE